MKFSLKFFIMGGFFYLLICGFQSQDSVWTSFFKAGEYRAPVDFSLPKVSFVHPSKTPASEKKPAETIASLLAAADFFSRSA